MSEQHLLTLVQLCSRQITPKLVDAQRSVISHNLKPKKLGAEQSKEGQLGKASSPVNAPDHPIPSKDYVKQIQQIFQAQLS